LSTIALFEKLALQVGTGPRKYCFTELVNLCFEHSLFAGYLEGKVFSPNGVVLEFAPTARSAQRLGKLFLDIFSNAVYPLHHKKTLRCSVLGRGRSRLYFARTVSYS
jgi:hypothetical protein